MAGMNRWKTKVAFVTGANGGIGMAITRKLLDSGLTVVAIDLQTEALLVSTALLRAFFLQLILSLNIV